MPKTTVLQPNQTQFFSSKRLFISKIIVPITSTAVAVMFTFSFGSAFAVAPAPAADQYARANVSALYSYVAEEQAKVEAAIDKAESDALYAIFQGKASVKLGTGNLVVTSEQVKAYYDSEVVAKAKARAAKEASDIYQNIQAALNHADTEYIGVVSEKDKAGAWDANADGKVTGYNVYVEFTGTVDGTEAPNYGAVFDKVTLEGTKAADIAKDAFAAMVTAKLAEIAAITPESYVAKDQEKVAELKAKASTLVTKLANRVANSTFNFEDVAAAYTGTLTLDADVSTMVEGFAGALAAIYTPAVNEAPASGCLATELGKLTLSADEPTQAAKLAWAKAQVTKKFEDAINAAYDAAVAAPNKTLLNESLKGAKADQAKIDAANEAIDNAKKEKDAALQIAAYLVEDCDTLDLLIAENKDDFASSAVRFASGTFTAADGKTYYNWNYAGNALASPLIKTANGAGYYSNLPKVVEYVQDVKDQATALKNDIAIDGTIAVDVDALEKDAIDDVYKTGAAQTLPSNTMNLVLHTRKHALTGVDCFGTALPATSVKVNGKTYNTVNAWSEAKYEDARLDEVKAIKKETKTAIMDATTVADAEAAFLAGLDKYKAVLDTDAKALNQAAKAFVDLKTKYVAQLAADLNYTIAGIEAAKANNNAANDDVYLRNLEVDLAKAYTTDELTEAYNKLSAEVKALKDKTTLDAEKKALEERCKAFSNVTVTLENKADLVALRKDVAAFRIYAARIGANGYAVADYGLNNKVTAIANLEKKAVEDQYKLINKDGKATLDEAAAVKELRAAYDAYNDGWDDFSAELESNHGFTYTPVSAPNLVQFEKDIFKAQVDAVESAIAKLPADGSDVAATKAARTAYDALTLCQKVTVADKYYDKLVDVEKLVSKAVTSLKLTAKSSAKKGSITVKWTVKGDASVADGYQVWKSTKQSKGYKKAITTTKKSYKNTKGLKKGTRYYYKVRAYKVVDGKNVYSDWSNKAYRVAK